MYKEYSINKKDNLYYLYKEDIEEETIQLLEEFFPECLERPTSIPIDKLAVKLGLDIMPAILSNDGKSYGTFVFNKGSVQVIDELGNETMEHYDEKTILIDSKILELNNRVTRFTIGHEIGHYWTQYKLKHEIDGQMNIYQLISKEEKAKYYLDNKKIIDNRLDDIYTFSYLEWQPNYFSSCILIPKKTLDMKIVEIFPSFEKRQLTSNLDEVSKNEFKSIVDVLSNTFKVSKEAMKNRLNSLGYITRRW